MNKNKRILAASGNTSLPDGETNALSPDVNVSPSSDKQPARELGGRQGLEPTRYGDWEKNGIISDF